MPITLQNLAETGELAYIGKHNANIDALRAFINSMESTLGSVSASAASPINAINIGKATFGPSGVVLIGLNSFATSAAGSNLTLQPGFYWSGGTAQMFYKASSTVLGFTGRAAATYYISMDATGLPQIATSSAGAMHSVVWTGSAFGTITKIATYAPGYQDFLDMLSSAYSGISYATPDARLEAIEKAISAQVTANVASADVTLTDAQAMEAAVINITGAPAAVRNVIVPSRAKLYGVRNTATGGFAVTVKTLAGTGVALADGEGAILLCDGTNVVLVLSTTGGGGASTFTALSDTPGSYAGQANKIVKVKADETGLDFDTATAPGVFTGLTDAPASYAGEALKVPRVNAGETGLEFFTLLTAFLGLTDAPSSYAGSAYRVLSVNGAETGLEFTAAASPSAFLGLADTPSIYTGSELQYLRVNAAGTALEYADGAGAGATTFAALTDTPLDYSASNGYFVKVNAAGDGLEFVSVGVGSFTALSDTPSSLTGAALKVLTVSGDELSIGFSDLATPTSFIGLTDAPANYTGAASKTVKVKGDASGLEFVAEPLSGSYRGTFGNPSLPYTIDFEGGVQPADFTDSGTNGWTVVASTDVTAGTSNALLSKDITYAQTTDATFDIDVVGGGGDMVIRYDTNGFSVHGNPSFWDKFSILVDAVEQTFTQASTPDYTSFTVPVTAGGHTVKLRLYNNTDLQTCEARVSQIKYPVPDPDGTYKYGDVVDYSGGRYLCLTAGTLENPSVTSDWQFLSAIAGDDFLGLADTPASFSGQALKGVRVNAAGTALEFHDEPAVIGVAWNGAPGADAVLGLFTAPFAINFAAAIAGSYGITLTAATAQTDIAVDKIEAGTLTVTAVGTVRFAAAGTAPTFIAASPFALAAGDALRFKAPATPDATLADFSFSIVGSK